MWLLDSDCSRHMTLDTSMFINFIHNELAHITNGDDNRGKTIDEGIVDYSSIIIVDNVLLVK